MITTRTFKSGNSVAVRLPKALGIAAGTEMRVREEEGRYVLERVVAAPKRIDLTGIYGAVPGLARPPVEPGAGERDGGRA